MIIASVMAALFLLLQQPIQHVVFIMMKTEPSVWAFAADYYDIRIWGAPFALLNYCILGWLIGASNVKKLSVFTTLHEPIKHCIRFCFKFII